MKNTLFIILVYAPKRCMHMYKYSLLFYFKCVVYLHCNMFFLLCVNKVKIKIQSNVLFVYEFMTDI